MLGLFSSGSVPMSNRLVWPERVGVCGWMGRVGGDVFCCVCVLCHSISPMLHVCVRRRKWQTEGTEQNVLVSGRVGGGASRSIGDLDEREERGTVDNCQNHLHNC